MNMIKFIPNSFILIALGMLCFVPVVSFSDVPNTFQDGDVISADEFNENFNYFEDILKAQFSIVRANGEKIGLAKDYYPGKSTGIEIYNDNLSFIFSISTSGKIATSPNLYFKNIDCQGTPYRPFYTSGFQISPSKMKIIGWGENIYYHPKHPQMYRFTSLSHTLYADSCVNESTERIFVEMLPNDPSVTGISTYPFPAPITIDGASMSIIQE